MSRSRLTTWTLEPVSTKWRIKLLPMKPQPPVMRSGDGMFLLGDHPRSQAPPGNAVHEALPRGTTGDKLPIQREENSNIVRQPTAATSARRSLGTRFTPPPAGPAERPVFRPGF